MLRMQESSKTDQFNIKTATFKTFSFWRKVQRARVTVTDSLKIEIFGFIQRSFAEKTEESPFPLFFFFPHTKFFINFLQLQHLERNPQIFEFEDKNKKER